MSNCKLSAHKTHFWFEAKHTHIQKTHRNHTQFGLDWSIINSNYKNSANFASPNSSKHCLRLENNGDLINEIYLRIK